MAPALAGGTGTGHARRQVVSFRASQKSVRTGPETGVLLFRLHAGDVFQEILDRLALRSGEFAAIALHHTVGGDE